MIQVVLIWDRVPVPGTVLDQYLVRFDSFNDPLMHFIQRVRLHVDSSSEAWLRLVIKIVFFFPISQSLISRKKKKIKV